MAEVTRTRMHGVGGVVLGSSDDPSLARVVIHRTTAGLTFEPAADVAGPGFAATGVAFPLSIESKLDDEAMRLHEVFFLVSFDEGVRVDFVGVHHNGDAVKVWLEGGGHGAETIPTINNGAITRLAVGKDLHGSILIEFRLRWSARVGKFTFIEVGTKTRDDG